MGVFRLAIRNVSRQRRRSILIATAVGVGFLVITIVNGLTAGALGALKSNFADLAGGHVFVAGEQILPSGRIVENVEDQAIVEATATAVVGRAGTLRRRSRAVADVISGPRVVSQVVDGVDFETESDLVSSLVPTDGQPGEIIFDELGIILPQSVADVLRVVAGERVTLRLSTVTGQTNVGEFVVVAMFQDPVALGIGRGYLHLDRLNDLIGLPPDGYQNLTVSLNNPRRMNRIANRLADDLDKVLTVAPRGGDGGGFEFAGFALPGAVQDSWEGLRYSVSTLDDLLSQILALIQVLDAVSIGVFVILLAITMVGINNSYRMIVLERTSEIGTMRAMGMQRMTVRRLFVEEALITTAIGLVFAGGLAAIIVLAVRLIPVDAPGVQFLLRAGRIPLTIGLAPVIRNSLIVLAMSLLAAVRPAALAARIEPASAIGRTV